MWSGGGPHDSDTSTVEMTPLDDDDVGERATQFCSHVRGLLTSLQKRDEPSNSLLELLQQLSSLQSLVEAVHHRLDANRGRATAALIPIDGAMDEFQPIGNFEWTPEAIDYFIERGRRPLMQAEAALTSLDAQDVQNQHIAQALRELVAAIPEGQLVVVTNRETLVACDVTIRQLEQNLTQRNHQLDQLRSHAQLREKQVEAGDREHLRVGEQTEWDNLQLSEQQQHATTLLNQDPEILLLRRRLHELEQLQKQRNRGPPSEPRRAEPLPTTGTDQEPRTPPPKS